MRLLPEKTEWRATKPYLLFLTPLDRKMSGGKMASNLSVETRVLTVGAEKLTPLKAVERYRTQMPRFRDILPLSKLDKNSKKNVQIIEDINSIVVRENRHVQFGTFYFYNKKDEPIGDVIKSSLFRGNIRISNSEMPDLEKNLQARGIIKQSIDGDAWGSIFKATPGEPTTAVLEGKEYAVWRDAAGLIFAKKSKNILHVPKDFQDMKNAIVMCDVPDVPMCIWMDDGAVHGEFTSTKGIATVEIFYQESGIITRLSTGNWFHLPVSEKAGKGEEGMNAITRGAKDGPSFGLASVFGSASAGYLFADISNTGNKERDVLIWK